MSWDATTAIRNASKMSSSPLMTGSGRTPAIIRRTANNPKTRESMSSAATRWENRASSSMMAIRTRTSPRKGTFGTAAPAGLGSATRSTAGRNHGENDIYVPEVVARLFIHWYRLYQKWAHATDHTSTQTLTLTPTVYPRRHQAHADMTLHLIIPPRHRP